MENKQKIWLAVSLLMFLIPEILWPQSTVIIYSWIREIFFGVAPRAGEFADFSILFFSNAPQLSNILLLIKIFGLIMGFVYSIGIYRNNNKPIVLWLIIILGLLLIANGFYIMFLMNFNPQFG